MFDYFKMALMNLNKRKLRTAINTFSISIGVMLIVVMLSLGTGFQRFMSSSVKELNNLNHVVVDSTKYLSDEDIEKALTTTNEDGDIGEIFEEKLVEENVLDVLSEDDRIDDLLVKYNGEVSEIEFNDKKAKDVEIAYYEGASYLDSELESLTDEQSNEEINFIHVGRDIKENDTKSILLPEDFVRNTLQVEDVESILGEKILIKSMIPDYEETKTFEEELTIIGIIDHRFYQPSLLVSKDIMERFKGFEAEEDISLDKVGADSLELSVSDVEDVEDVVDYIEIELSHNTQSVAVVASTVDNAMTVINIILSLIGIIVILVASLDVVNTMIMSIYEKTKTIGLMRATGASKRDIRFIFLVESATIGLLGGIVGVVLSMFGLVIVRGILSSVANYFEFTDTTVIYEVAKLDIKTALLTILFSIILTVVAGIYPSIRASKLDPIEAIKHD